MLRCLLPTSRQFDIPAWEFGARRGAGVQIRLLSISKDTRRRKTRISRWVIGEIGRRKGRFRIEGPQGFWVELKNKEVARVKVANAFRDLRKMSLPHHQTLTTDSSTMKFARLNGRKRKRME
jgi:hypothetical protein